MGAFIPGAPADPAALDAFAEMIGRMPAIVHWYQEWGGDFNRFDHRLLETVTDRGATPLISWEPWAGLQNDRAYALRTIINGDHDTFIWAWASDAAAWDRPLYLRFAPEMNGRWNPWSPGVNGNRVEEFGHAWRRVVDIFRAAGADNVRWVWCPNVTIIGSTPLANVYPGDDYVDWLCLDGYNWGRSQEWSRQHSLVGVFRPSVRELRQFSELPVMLGEMGSAEEGGDKGEWIREGFAELPVALPDVRAVVWFNAPYDPPPGFRPADWRIESSPGSLAAFREAVSWPEYSGTLP